MRDGRRGGVQAGWIAACLVLSASALADAPRSLPFPPPRPAGLAPGGRPAGVVSPAAPPASGATAQDAAGQSAPASESACLRALSALSGNRIRRPEAKLLAASDPACSIADPVTVEALAARKADGPGQIVFHPPVTLACEMARSLADWLDVSLQPLARGSFGQDLTRLRVGGGFECRRRNRQSAGLVSEHATGRALDIFAFGVGDAAAGGFEVVVEKPGGLLQSRFVQAARHSACGAFSTSLGPGADEAHANHLHLDIQPRRSASTRFCQ